MKKNARAWVALNLIPGVGPVAAHRLAAACGSAAAVFRASRRDLESVRGIRVEALAALFRQDWLALAEHEQARSLTLGCQLLTWEDDGYPENLRRISFPPPVLYLRGTLRDRDQAALAVVGSRRPSVYGLAATRKLVRELVQSGLTIVSGLARGIDAEAHDTAIQARGRTLAVVANGLDQLYPAEHHGLQERILKRGAVLSEFPLGTQALAGNFPRRNRIISGLAQGVFVVEAGARSGALITARWAGEQGREVFALPGPYLASLSLGTHALIQDGAKLVTQAQDILDELPTRLPATKSESGPDLDDKAQAIRQVLEAGEQHIDELAAKCAEPVERLLAALLHLEVQGLIRSVPGQRYHWTGP